jgi:hypothetical protein
VTLELRLDNQGECINAAQIDMSYPKDKVEVIDVSRGDSIFNIWVVPPTVRRDFGLISMVGGIPGGYCGRVPGDPAVTNIIAKPIIRFKDAIQPLPATIRISVLPTSRVVLNDGVGTEAKLASRDAEITIAKTGTPQRNTWTDTLKADKTSPEEFTIEVHRDASIFEGKYFAIFSTQDKQSGLDRYEVREGGGSSWRRIESPYLLDDQTLHSVIRVKAIDKAGNERIVEYLPQGVPGSEPKKFLFWFVGIATVFLAVAFRIFRIPWPW